MQNTGLGGENRKSTSPRKKGTTPSGRKAAFFHLYGYGVNREVSQPALNFKEYRESKPNRLRLIDL
jgi:hypothetical protein